MFTRLAGCSFVLAAVVVGACGKSAEQGAQTKPSGLPPVNVTVSPVKVMELQRAVKVVGNLVGFETATLSNRTTGTVSKIYVDRGDRVKPNAKLLEIEPERFRLAVEESQASLAQTLARLGLKEVPGPDFDINETAPVKKAQSEYVNAKSKMDRATPLNQSKAMNDFEYLDIVSAFKSSESALEASRDEARALVAQARQNRTTIDMRAKDFRDSTIIAPDGTTPDGMAIENYVVSERKVSAGEYLREGTAVFVLMADAILKLQARVPERYLADVKKDAVLNFHVEAYPGEAFVGKVHTIDPAVDPASRTFMVEALVDNVKYGHRLRPGSFVPGEVLTTKETGRIMVPQEAVTSFVGVTKVYKLEGVNKVRAVTVETGQQTKVTDESGKETQWVEILKGNIKGDDQVAVSGLTKLVDGSGVVIDEARKRSAETKSMENAAALNGG